jgi:hypothetical protein
MLQLIPPPLTARPYDPCYNLPDDQNSLKSFCGAAYHVTVTKGIIRTVPLELGSFKYKWPESSGVLNCKDLNASGLFTRAPSVPRVLHVALHLYHCRMKDPSAPG